MLTFCLWTTLPWTVLGQAYYLSFVFNNFRPLDKQFGIYAPAFGLYTQQPRQRYKEDKTLELNSLEDSQRKKQSYLVPNMPRDDSDTLELSSMEKSNEDNSIWIFPTTKRPKKSKETTHKFTTNNTTTTSAPNTTISEKDTPESAEEITMETINAALEDQDKTTRIVNEETETTEALPESTAEETTRVATEELETTVASPLTILTKSTKRVMKKFHGIVAEETETTVESQKPTQKTTEVVKPRVFPPVTTHKPSFFRYPQARCHEEMDLHEVFGISLERDRGLTTKILCMFDNSWGGPWLLTTRIELPVRLHMRHSHFGYLTEDYKDLNTNFISLAHIMNSMRTAMLILGQDNNDQLVYNLYDDVVISSFNDAYMLRKAELVEANTTDLLFVSVGRVFHSFTGRNRSCPLQVIGGWWASHVLKDLSVCVFPLERNVKLPGYVAIFIKPSIFAVNNTALYHTLVSTRRPWVPTKDAFLWESAKKDKDVYETLQKNDFFDNKREVDLQSDHRFNILQKMEDMRQDEALQQKKSGR